MLKNLWGRVVGAVRYVGEAVSTGAGKVVAFAVTVIGVGKVAVMNTYARCHKPCPEHRGANFKKVKPPE